MGHINMTKCLNCGYERQPKDEGIIPPTECPRCGIIYDKAAPHKNEKAHVSHGPKQAEGDGREIKKVPTYLFQNIILVLLTAPAFALLMALVIRLASLKLFSWWLMSGIIAFIVAGTILSLSYARKVRHMAVSGQTEKGLKYAKRVNKFFLCVLVITWIFGILIGAWGPNYIAYRSRGYDAMAKNDLKNKSSHYSGKHDNWKTSEIVDYKLSIINGNAVEDYCFDKDGYVRAIIGTTDGPVAGPI